MGSEKMGRGRDAGKAPSPSSPPLRGKKVPCGKVLTDWGNTEPSWQGISLPLAGERPREGEFPAPHAHAADRLPLASPLLDLDALPLRPAAAVAAWGPTCVVAPHPDDESLGCGGAIALLCAMGIPVSALFVSDGAKSHPTSRAWPARKLRGLREQEARDALAVLGVAPEASIFLGLPDTAVPMEGAAGFGQAVGAVRDHFAAWQPRTVLVPWRRDFHCDHRAAWEIVRVAVRDLRPRPRVIEYPIWVWEHLDSEHLPAPGEVVAWRLDIASVISQKQSAIAKHRSQTTNLIDDDPEGFVLLPEVLARFARPWEIYLETPA